MPSRSSRTPSQWATRVAFAVIALFVLAQAGWWILFQQRYIGDVTAERLAAWERDAVTADLALEAAGGDLELREALLTAYPHLRWESGAGFAVDPERREAFVREQRGFLRMFAFEGPFFVLVILGLLGFIALALRAERELKRRQQNFLSAVTHEFKTPISTLRLLVQTARMRALTPDKQRDYLRRMEGELDRLERTSEQVLASARLEQAGEAPVLAPSELGEAVRRVLDAARQGLEARGAELTLHPGSEPLPVSIDEDAFALVLHNLLDNAVKYSPGPDRPIRIALEADGDLALVHVDDWGIGIPEGERQAIFRRFYRRGDEMTRESTGVGLGLHLVQRVSEAMNGWVRVGPNPDAPERRGSRFTVVLPRRLTQDPPAAAPEGAARTGAEPAPDLRSEGAR